MNKAAKLVVDTLQLQAHPEGGWFKETYRSTGKIAQKELPKEYGGSRNYSTGIYFLLTSDSFSAFHKIHQDEMWHFYDGAYISIHMIFPDGTYLCQKVGRNLGQGELPQFTVPGGVYFAASVNEENAYSLCGCTVAPGFDFQDFVMPSRKALTELFPQHKEIIEQLTHSKTISG